MSEVSETNETVNQENSTTEQNGSDQQEANSQETKTYTQEELDEILKGYKSQDEVEKLMQERVAREKQAQKKAIEEAEKLAKMDAEEKAEYKREQERKQYEEMQKEVEKLKQQNNYNAMSKQAATMLAEEKITANDDVLSMVVVADNAEQTQANIKAFSKLVKDGIATGVKEALKGDSIKASRQSDPPDEFKKHLSKYE